MPVTPKFLIFVTGTFDFSRAHYRKLSRARPKFSRAFFPKFSRASWKISRALWKIVVTGTFRFVTGTFVLWSHFFFWFTALTTKVIFGVSLVASWLFSVKKARTMPIKLNYPPLIKSGFGDFQKWSVKLPPLPWISAAGDFFFNLFFLLNFE